MGLWKRCRVVIAGDISFPILDRRTLGTAGSMTVSEPERRRGKGKRCMTIRIIGPTRSDVSRIGVRLVPITGRNTVRSILIRRSAIVTISECGTESAMGAIWMGKHVLYRIGE